MLKVIYWLSLLGWVTSGFVFNAHHLAGFTILGVCAMAHALALQQEWYKKARIRGRLNHEARMRLIELRDWAWLDQHRQRELDLLEGKAEL